MGWDYWMRVAFRRAGKECIIPEVSRSHHVAEKGSSVNSKKSVELFTMMTFADVPSFCKPTEICEQFGDVSYLIAERYEASLRAVIETAPRINNPAELDAAKLDSSKVYVIPYKYESNKDEVMFKLGVRPRSHRNIIPKDIRSEHYGVFAGRHKDTIVLAVDMRSQQNYLRASERIMRNPNMKPVVGKPDTTCTETCTEKGLQCRLDQMPFLNDCDELRKVFPCEQGCAHQVGKELPVYVSASIESTFQQCLVTFISPMSCEGKHKSTTRICACMPVGMPSAGMS